MRGLLIYALGTLGAATACVPQVDAERIQSVSLQRTACYGSCPIYSVTVSADGSAVYTGERFVITPGMQEATLSREQLQRLSDALNDASFWTLGDSYDEVVRTDHSSVRVAVTVDGQTKSVHHYLGDSHAPQRLATLEDTIDRITGVERWVGSPAERDEAIRQGWWRVVENVESESFAQSPHRGNPNAKVTIVEFGDLEAPDCSRMRPVIDRIFAAYPGQVVLFFLPMPNPARHPNAFPVAIAAMAAANQGKFWEFHDLALENQADLSRANYLAWAAQLHLDALRFLHDLDDPATLRRVADAASLGRKKGGDAPTFLIDGRRILGAQPFERFRSIIDGELRRADALIDRGVSRERLYDALLACNRKHPGSYSERPAEDCTSFLEKAPSKEP